MTQISAPKNRISTKKCKQKSNKRKISLIERDAFIRTFNGNGANPNLPPLPIFSETCGNEEAIDGNNNNNNSSSGLATLYSHPYGSLPFGNIYLSPRKNKDEVRHNGLGPRMRFLNDEQVLNVLAFADGNSLSRLVQCSRYLYVAGHHDELWRDLMLRKFESWGVDFKDSWRDTYVNKETKNKGKYHEPIVMKGIYSDTFFRSWLCRSFELHPSCISINSVPTEEVSSITLKKFLTKYEEKNQPVLIKGATRSWPAVQKWNQEYLIEQTHGVSFRATSGAAPLPAQFRMESYAKYCASTVEEAPLYLFDRTFAKTCPQLLEDYVNALKSSCPYFDSDAEHGHDLFSLLGADRRPDHRWIIVGPKRSGSSFHIDPNATHAWNAPIIGRKRWIFYPPGINPPGVFPSPSGDDVAMPISLGEWFLTYWNDHVKERTNPNVSKRPLECTVHPGDILFVPHGWWHCVLNLDDGLSVGLTQNYVSSSNLPSVLRFLKMKKTQISGCRDRDNAVQPEDLLEEFTTRLKQVRPSLLASAQSLAEKGWRCAAWMNDENENHCDTFEQGGNTEAHKKKKAENWSTKYT